METKTEIFNLKPKGDLKDEKYQSFAAYDDFLFIGDTKGKVHAYRLDSSGKYAAEPIPLSCDSGKKIEQIVIPSPKCCAALSRGVVYLAIFPTMAPQFKIPDDSISKLAINQNSSYQSNLLMIAKKNKLKVGKVDLAQKTFIEHNKSDKGIIIDDKIEVYEWYGDLFCYASGDKIKWINVETGKTYVQVLENVKNIKYIQESWFILAGNFGLFFDTEGVKPFNTIEFKYDVIDYFGYKNYIIALHEESIVIHALDPSSESKVAQSIVFKNEKGKQLLTTVTSKMTIITTSPPSQFNIYELREEAYEAQVSILLEANKIPEALNKLNDNISSLDEGKQKLIEQFFIDCAWLKLKQSNFTEALNFACLTPFNPFEFIYMFYTFLDLDIIHKDMSETIKHNMTDNQIDNLYKDKAFEKEKKSAIQFLIDLLKSKKAYLLSRYKDANMNEIKIEFMTSNRAIINLSKSKTDVTLEYTLYYIDLTLIKTMIKHSNNPKDIAEIIDCAFFRSKDPFSKENKYLTPEFLGKAPSPMIQATKGYLYEKEGLFKDALDIWKGFNLVNFQMSSQSIVQSVYFEEAVERSKGIFLRFKEEKNKESNKRLFQEYMKWMLVNEKSRNEIFEVITTTDLINIDYFNKNIVPSITETPNLKMYFLEYMNSKLPTEKYQTLLIETYIDMLTKDKKSDDLFNFENLPEFLKQIYNNMFQVLQHPEACYHKSNLLSKVKGTNLTEVEIFLDSELNHHHEALIKILQMQEGDRPDFTRIEKYCKENIDSKPDIFSEFFGLLADEYQEPSIGSYDEKGKSETRMKMIKKEMLKVMIDNCDCVRLDPVFVLSKIPDDWNVAGGDLHRYITSVIRTYSHLVNKYKNGRNLSDIALLYKEKEAFLAKNKTITIDNDLNCELCKKKIGTTLFVVYPNMKAYHSKCAINPSICPVSGIDFNKKKFIN